MSDEGIQVPEPRVGCVATERCDGGGDVGARAQHEVCECATRARWKLFDVEGERLVGVRTY